MEQSGQTSGVSVNPDLQTANNLPVSPAIPITSIPQQNIPEVEPAGFYLRYLAYFVDTLILGIGIIILSILIAVLSGFGLKITEFLRSPLGVFLGNVPSILITILYFVLYTYKFGRTPGKKFLGLKVVQYQLNQTPTLNKVLIREISKQFILTVVNLATTALFVIAAYFLIIKNLYKVASLVADSNFIDSSIKLILLFLLIVIAYFIVLYLIYYKVFFTWREGKRGIQDVLAGTQVVIINHVGKFRKLLVLIVPLIILLAVLGVIAASVLIAVNPAKRRNQAMDASTKNDIGIISTALIQYSIAKNTFPETLDSLVTNGDLDILPVRSDGVEYSYLKFPLECLGIAGNECNSVAVYSPLLSPAIAGNVWCWRSNSFEAPKEVSDSECTP